MNIIDVLSAPWAILPDKLQEMCSIYRAHLHGEKADIPAIEAALGKSLNNEPKGYEVVDNVAVLPLEGIIAKRMNLFTRISGGISTQLFQRDLKMAVKDEKVNSIILLIDSPGGSVDGLQAAANAVKSVRGIKPIITVADGMMASAAYWIGSAADSVYLSEETSAAGSIGVVAEHIDTSAREEKAGIKVTEIYAGKYKRIASEHAPLTKEGREYIQDRVDHIYTIFVNAVAENRNANVETVLKSMADGRLFIGQKAIDAGLVDGIKTLDEAIEMLNRENIKGAQTPISQKGNSMDKITILGKECATQADIDAAVNAAVEASKAAGVKEGESKLSDARTEGAKTERERIQSVYKQSFPGFESIVADAMFDGKSQAGDVAMKINAANLEAQKKAGNDLSADAPKPVPETVTDKFPDAASGEMTEAKLKAKWEKDPDFRAEFANDFDVCKALYLDNEGVNIKVYKSSK